MFNPIERQLPFEDANLDAIPGDDDPQRREMPSRLRDHLFETT
jgi:hypothetical protein